MREKRLDLQAVFLVAWIFACPLSRAQEAASCDYIYLLQPPRELPCNPYQMNPLTGAYEYSITLQCAVAQSSSRDDSKIRWMQQLTDSEQRRVPIEPDSPYEESATISVAGDFIIYESELQISKLPQPSSDHTFWCVLHASDDDQKTNLSALNAFANRATVHGPELYSSLPPCPRTTPLHLAESVCVNSNSSQMDEVTPFTEPCPSNRESCGAATAGTEAGSNSTEGSSGTGSGSKLVIVGAGVAGGVVLVLLAATCTLVLCLCLRRRKRRHRENKHQSRTNGLEWGSIVSPTEIIDRNLGNQTPPTTTTTPPEQNSAAVVTERASVPSLVVPQKPIIPPPTLRRPVSAQSRAASLLRQLQRPHKHVVDRKTPTSAAKTQFEDDSRKEQGLPPRKKPYKSLELNTVDTPHLYMTRSKSPMQARKPLPRKPPPVLQNNPRTVSRERLLLMETVSNGYVAPGSSVGMKEEEDESQQAYQEIEAEMTDYLALYTVPRQRSPSTSSEEHQPIYEEPRPN